MIRSIRSIRSIHNIPPSHHPSTRKEPTMNDTPPPQKPKAAGPAAAHPSNAAFTTHATTDSMVPWATYQFRTTPGITYEVDPSSFKLSIHLKLPATSKDMPCPVSPELQDWLQLCLPRHAVAALCARIHIFIADCVRREHLMLGLEDASVDRLDPD